jgi:hypothetical protein
MSDFTNDREDFEGQQPDQIRELIQCCPGTAVPRPNPETLRRLRSFWAAGEIGDEDMKRLEKYYWLANRSDDEIEGDGTTESDEAHAESCEMERSYFVEKFGEYILSELHHLVSNEPLIIDDRDD